MSRDEQIDMFLTLLNGEHKHHQETCNILLDKLYYNPDDDKSFYYLNVAETKRKTIEHVIELTKTCFK